MSLNISKIRDAGTHEKERIVIRAESECEIGAYLVLRTGIKDAQPTTFIKDAFWIPDRRAKKGDYVVIYSKAGASKTKINRDGSTTHFFYQHKTMPLWGDKESCVVLIEAERWKALTPDEFFQPDV